MSFLSHATRLLIRGLGVVYGTASYAFSMAMFVLFILFAINHVGLLGYPSLNIDNLNGPPSEHPVLVNLLLLALFALQHSIMARPAFKLALSRLLPASWERATYCLARGVVLLMLVQFWQPMSGQLWSVEQPVLRGILTGTYYQGWVISLAATFMLNHLHLFGLQQVFKVSDPDSGMKVFRTPMFYQLVRHPIQTGVVVSMLATPDMSLSRAMLALGMLAHVAVGLALEERDLVREFGDTYRDYKQRVPAVIPALWRR
ncbi:MAG: isoprenylcysteine carboxylmethyltransferase family protein [Halieaceae bacterium]|nr:isoprenylcysteine carboxylmethyltransferase family protein [Halieaceae bacterium]